MLKNPFTIIALLVLSILVFSSIIFFNAFELKCTKYEKVVEFKDIYTLTYEGEPVEGRIPMHSIPMDRPIRTEEIEYYKCIER